VVEDLFVIVNPSSRPKPVLHVLSSVCRDVHLAWDVGVTRGAGDAVRMAQAARQRGVPVVAVYGGDGSIMETARGLMHGDSRLAILPGGTSNAVAVELGIPDDLEQAVRLACGVGAESRPLDMGRVGEATFVLRAGIGLSAEQVRKADRAFKNRFGKIAYAMALASVLKKARPARYHAELDGEPIEWEGPGCMIDNAGGFGVPGLTHDPAVDLSDGRLDVFLSRTVPLGSVLAVLADDVDEPAMIKNEHRTARRIVVRADPPQALQLDGEVWGETPVTVEVIPGAAAVLVPIGGAVSPKRRRRGTARVGPVV
jgi:YegS/Rv2252/BmrU family lipid kinase